MSVKLNIKPLEKLIKTVDKAGQATSAAPLGAMFLQWGSRYLTFTRRRYKRLSRGGGGWAPLKATTARRRKKARRSSRGKKRRHSILIDTGTLVNSLSIGSAGNLRERLKRPAGVRVGFSEARHNSDSLSIQRLAVIHDQGLGNNPRRPILVDPDQRTRRGMMSDSRKATEAILVALDMRGGV